MNRQVSDPSPAIAMNGTMFHSQCGIFGNPSRLQLCHLQENPTFPSRSCTAAYRKR